jgi:hypothetical protein
MISENDDYLVVHAFYIDQTHIKYKCPYCWKLRSGRVLDSNYDPKKKRIYASAVPGTHMHGSAGDLGNRYETRSSHCTINNDKEVKIIIDENTKKINKKNKGVKISFN